MQEIECENGHETEGENEIEARIRKRDRMVTVRATE